MRIDKFAVTASIMLAAAIPTMPSANSAPIGPIGQSWSLPDHDSTLVQYRRRSRDVGPAVAAGIFGAIIGGIIASQNRPYAVYPYQTYPSYPGYYPAYRYPSVDAAIAYCIRRYRSYDPYSMTYLGYDGYRHACP